MIHFYKYHGTGNDFVIINMTKNSFSLTTEQIAFICDRHKGIGADGLMMLLNSEDSDFRMKYYNSDGKEGSMCGNGGRCMLAFAYDMGITKEVYRFIAIDGNHEGRILKEHPTEKLVELKMSDVHETKSLNNNFEINTGSPHYLDFREEVEKLDVVEEGKAIRYSDAYQEEGINVNFVEQKKNQLYVRTYERGVENETLACGTGVTAAAIASSIRQNLIYKNFNIKVLGGQLNVKFETEDGNFFHSIYLTGPAVFVYEGHINIPF
ncbi:diaminopimelate epimerase [Lentimicrobium sp. L6]|uniref:diaminopimelate epimerase n=1 Tax=Lentimicrobium sp. L6 TaxID=2735916 RepID=UPI001554E1BB|nr:diaminopimelate epimerase [Lentimicrobium sp. L6]NPD84499.1 diaminopimelate epimerase [Lentimicrobium sp. L6]